jgi:methylmalonyl-CoA mutase cobalamin-binding subunit
VPELERLASSATAARAREASPPARTAIDNTSIFHALERFDTAGLEIALGRASAALAPAELLREVVVPVLTAVGSAWSERRGSVAHEHLVSAVIRNVLGSALHVYGRPQSSVRVVLATPEHEPHEFGVLGAAVLAASAGLDAIYLGPGIPATDLADCAVTAQADVVVLGITAAEHGDAIQREVAEIARRLPKDVELWLGGRAAERMAATIRPRALVVNDYEMFQTELARVAGL